MIDLLKTLCTRNGISGREEAVRDYIIQQISSCCTYRIDPMGNLIADVKGKNRSKNRVLFTAHMDEVGFIITQITKEGYLKFAPVGGISNSVVAGRTVTVGEQGIPGVIGLKAIHLCEKDEAQQVPELSSLFIDIGASGDEEAKQYVSVGDAAYFDSPPVELGETKLKAKAIDDRFGCALMVDMIQKGIDYDATFAFLVQEEVGLRGAGPAVCGTDPDYAVVLEATTAADVAGVEETDRVCVQGCGAVVSFMDRTTVYDPKLFRKAIALAEKNGIPVQTKTTVAGGNDAGVIHKTNCGVRTLCVSLPCRYIHCATSVADIRDMKACRSLAEALLAHFADAERSE